ncbi:thioredoxin family protein [bacterium]|nr:thioredoxin family protein [bacterium]
MDRTRCYLTLFIISFLTSLCFPCGSWASDEIVTLRTSLSGRPVPGQQLTLTVSLTISQNWHINAHKPAQDFLIPTEITLDPEPAWDVLSITYPEPEKVTLDFFDEILLVYSHGLEVQVQIGLKPSCPPGEKIIKGSLTYQGCDNTSCRSPKTLLFAEPVKIVTREESDLGSSLAEQTTGQVPEQTSLEKVEPERGVEQSLDQRGIEVGPTSSDTQVQQIVARGMLFALLSFFLVGLGLNLTPCVYPVIPITISYFATQAGEHKGSRFTAALAYALGIALVFTVLGLVSSLAGQQWGFLFQNTWFVIIIALFILAMAASMFGAFEIKIPTTIMTRLGQTRQGVIGALLMGLTVGVVIAPCAAGIILGLITLVAEQGLVFQGSLYFFFMGLGLGLPYLILASFSTFLTKMPRSGMWMIWIRKLFGVVLVGVAFYFIAPQAARIADQKMFFMGLITLFGGLYLGFLDQNHGYSSAFNKGRAIFGVVVAVIGAFMLQSTLGHSADSQAHGNSHSPIAWTYYSKQSTDTFLKSDKPIIIDFYADWCAPCRALDKKTFAHPGTVEAARNFTMIKVDGTVQSSDIKNLMKTLSVTGYPSILFLSPTGHEFTDLRVTGFIDPQDLLNTMKILQKRSGIQ